MSADYSQAATTTFDGDLGASIRMQCTSLLNSLRQLHTVDPAKSETAKRFIEDSLRGLGIEWMSGVSQPYTDQVTSFSLVLQQRSVANSFYGIGIWCGWISCVKQSICCINGYALCILTPAHLTCVGHIRSNSNPFDAMESTSRAMPPQVPSLSGIEARGDDWIFRCRCPELARSTARTTTRLERSPPGLRVLCAGNRQGRLLELTASLPG